MMVSIYTYMHILTTKWQPVTVQSQAHMPRSYTVQSKATGTVYRRTRSQLKPDATAHISTDGMQELQHDRPISSALAEESYKQPVGPTEEATPNGSSRLQSREP